MPYSMPDLMRLIICERAEALHIHPGTPPVLEVKRMLHPLEGPKVAPVSVDEFLHGLADADHLSDFDREGMISFKYHFGDAAEFYIMAFRGNGHTTLEIRR